MTRRLQILACRTLLLTCLFAPLSLAGCGETAPPMDVRVTTPVGRAGVCAQCDKKIAKVTEKQVVTLGGTQYVICDEKCAADLKDWLAKQ